MRNVLIAAILAVATVGAAANPHGRHHHHRDWVGPAIAGAIIGGVIASQSRQDTPPPYPYVVVPQIVHPPMLRATPMPYRRAIDIYIPECSCYRTIQIIVWE